MACAANACGLTLENPCGVGVCLNDGTGGYSCLCPFGYTEDILKGGRRICSFLNLGNGRHAQQLLSECSAHPCALQIFFTCLMAQLTLSP